MIRSKRDFKMPETDVSNVRPHLKYAGIVRFEYSCISAPVGAFRLPLGGLKV